jgi:hypothetical protein
MEKICVISKILKVLICLCTLSVALILFYFSGAFIASIPELVNLVKTIF